MSNNKEQHSLQADKNVMKTLSALATVKPVCIITHVDFHEDISLGGRKVNYKSGSTLVFTLDTGERFGIDLLDRFEALRQYNYIKYLIEQGGGKIKIQP